MLAAFLRIGLFLTIWIGAWGAIAFPLFRKFQWRPFQVISPRQKLVLLLPLYGLAPLIIALANRYLGQSWGEIGVILAPETLRSLVAGVLWAASGLALFFGVKLYAKIVSVTSEINDKSPLQFLQSRGLPLLGLLAIALGIAGAEELVFRGWIQTQLEAALAPWLAAGVGSFLFAIAHLVWDGRAGLWQQPGLWLLGLVLVAARWLAGGSLALAWGLHAGWVWGLACLGEFAQPQPVAGKPVWLTGRPEQPLTSLLDFLLLGITIGGLWWGYGLA